MKHAAQNTLASIVDLIDEIRTRKGLTEKKPGIFYRKGKAFLHFHEDNAGMFMDIRDGAEWLRLPASEKTAQQKCLQTLDQVLAE